MRFTKTFDNGLRLVIDKIEGLFSVSAGVLVKAGSANETESENGISHFIEHAVFKGTKTRSAFEISDYIDRIGAQINAFTSKEMTCYYTKSTTEHLDQALEVLSDIFFNATFDNEELKKEKGVVIEEINMSNDTPEDLCFDILAKNYHGKNGYGQTILGPSGNIRRFTKQDIDNYMDKYYTADNVVISLAGNVDENKAIETVEKLFSQKFTRLKRVASPVFQKEDVKCTAKNKDIEQTHIAFAIPGLAITDKRCDALSIANVVFGGGMSSRLFQKIREELGLCYSVYSYTSQYQKEGVMEIYAGVNSQSAKSATQAILNEVKKMREGISEQEFLRGKEQIKSSFIMGRESTASQMLIYGKYLLFLDQELDFNKRVQMMDNVTIDQVNQVIEEIFNYDKIATAIVGSRVKPLKI